MGRQLTFAKSKTKQKKQKKLSNFFHTLCYGLFFHFVSHTTDFGSVSESDISRMSVSICFPHGNAGGGHEFHAVFVHLCLETTSRSLKCRICCVSNYFERQLEVFVVDQIGGSTTATTTHCEGGCPSGATFFLRFNVSTSSFNVLHLCTFVPTNFPLFFYRCVFAYPPSFRVFPSEHIFRHISVSKFNATPPFFCRFHTTM